MSAETIPAMAYPSFASATATFAPAAWPVRDSGGLSFERFEADARTAGGVFIKQSSPVVEKRVSLTYRMFTTAERDAFASPAGAGFLYSVNGASFEYRHSDGSIHSARFVSGAAVSTPAGAGYWNLGPIELVLDA
ncbi:MAG: hypothetical protein HZB29_13910 [Nitrospinae bacterium]|nr:hypothetical protein [Nitrospinota bacterium]